MAYDLMNGRSIRSALIVMTTLHSFVAESNSYVTTASQSYWVEEVARGLTFPTAIAWLPNADALITERRGSLRILRRGQIITADISGMPPVYESAFTGLKDIAVDPDFGTNGLIFLALSEGQYESYHTAVYSGKLEADQLKNLRRIFRSKDDFAGSANGVARILFLPDKTLLVAVPENNYYKKRAQQLNSHVGKIIRVTREGHIPSDNPFIGQPGALPEIWSYGHRVPTGLYFDDRTGQVWEVEPGPKGGDELNLLKAGGNFGWAVASWGFDYNGVLATQLQSGKGIEEPVLVWMQSPKSTPAGLTRYFGSTYPNWNGDFFVGHLTGRRLERLRIEGQTVVLQETLLQEFDERIREVKVGPDNHIYLLTDSEEGRVFRLRPGAPQEAQQKRVARRLQAQPKTESNLPPGDPLEGRVEFRARCAACHSVRGEIHGGKIGPDLSEVYGRRAGSLPDFNYSDVLAESPQVWDFGSMDLFIANPDGYMPGTNMLSAPVTDAEARRDIIAFLQDLGRTMDATGQQP
jgi:glucose/arabinose dehydrogenase/cytochrome c2